MKRSFSNTVMLVTFTQQQHVYLTVAFNGLIIKMNLYLCTKAVKNGDFRVF